MRRRGNRRLCESEERWRSASVSRPVDKEARLLVLTEGPCAV